MTLISVVMTVYNGEKYLREAIDSVLNQTHIDFEFIIVNDGSTDDSINIIESYSDERILLYNQENKGVSQVLNIAISHCKGKYIALIDQDDICMPNRFFRQFTYLEANHEISVLSGAVIYISETGNYLGRSFPITTVSLIKKKLLNSGSVINHPSVMMRKSDFDKVGGYSELIGDKFTDYHLWVKFVTKGYKIKNLPEVFLKYRIIQSSISSSFYLTKKGTEVLLKTIKIEFPTAQEVDLLKKSCQLSKESFAKRERTYKNLPNHIYEKLSFIGQKTRNNLFSGFQNLIAIFR